MNSNNYEGNRNVDDEFLYPADILLTLNMKNSYVHFDPPISISNPGENLILRPLSINDFHKGYLNLLAQLTKVGDVSEETFKETFQEMKLNKNRYFVTVVEDLTTNQIIGTATLAIEKKFIHSAGLRGRLEDVVVSNDYRGKQLGKLVVITIRLLAEHLGCYKVTLDCKDKMVKFYKQFGFNFETGNNTMTIRFKD